MIASEDPARVLSFSCPQHDAEGRRALVREILTSQARELTQGLLRRFGDTIRSRSEGLYEVLEQLVRRDFTLGEALGYPLPQHRGGWSEPDFDPLWPAVRAALHLQALGEPVSFRALLEQPRRLTQGIHISPPTIRVQARGGAVAVEPAEGGNPLMMEAWDTMSALPGVGIGVPIVDAAALPAFPFGNDVGWTEQSNAAVVANLREAFAVLQEYAPAYLPWVRDTLRYVVPVAPPAPDVRRSYSVKGLHGVVFMSFPASPIKTAETLVHECAHQHYHLAEEWFRLQNGRDERSYYSVYVRKERPIDRVLIAFHAFANVVLLHRDCVARNAPFADVCARIVAENEPHLAEFKTFLEGSNGLTKAGRAMWEPVMARMCA